jgi:hypothetical protein
MRVARLFTVITNSLYQLTLQSGPQRTGGIQNKKNFAGNHHGEGQETKGWESFRVTQ